MHNHFCFIEIFYFALSALQNSSDHPTQGVALGYYISRLRR